MGGSEGTRVLAGTWVWEVGPQPHLNKGAFRTGKVKGKQSKEGICSQFHRPVTLRWCGLGSLTELDHLYPQGWEVQDGLTCLAVGALA